MYRTLAIRLAVVGLIILAIAACVVVTQTTGPPAPAPLATPAIQHGQAPGLPGIKPPAKHRRLALKVARQRISLASYTPVVGVNTLLLATNGSWTGSPTSFTYQWQDCNSSGASCTNITGATGQTYIVKTSDEGYTIVVVVTAHNAGGQTSQASAPTGVIPAPAVLNGINVSGSELVTDTGATIHLHGVDVEGTEYQCAHSNGIFDTSNSATNAANMASWHINFVRLGLNADCVDCVLGVPSADCGTNYMTAIEQWVDLLNSEGIYVEIMLMWDYPCSANGCVGVTAANGNQLAGGPTQDNAPAAWTTMADDFKSNPNVMLGIWGEDYNQYPCRLAGGVCQSSFVQLAAATTTLSTGVAAGSVSSITVPSLSYALIAGETIWLGAGTDSMTVTSNVSASGSSTTIPVSGTLSTSYPSGSTLTYPSGDIGDHVGMTYGSSNIDEYYTTAGAQEAVTDMRDAGYTGPIVYSCADVANVCSDPTVSGGTGTYYGGTWLSDHPTDPDNSIVGAADLYGPSTSGSQTCSGTTCYQNTIAPIISAGYPFILNEAGPSYDGSECTSSYVATMLEWLDANGGSGYAAWSWFDNGGSCLDLITSYTSPTPNPDPDSTTNSYAPWLENYYTTTFPANS